MKLSEGDILANFVLPITSGDSNGGEFDLGQKRDQIICIFCYPKDDTSGCTAEAIDFTAHLDEFTKLGITLYGISPDPIKRHDKFIAKHNLGVTLISDEEKLALQSLGVWVEKSMYGRKYMGVERSTFLISPANKVLACWRKVKVPGHVDAVLVKAKEVARG